MTLLFKDKRFLLLVVLLALVSCSFWLLSRYPALDTKAMMAGSVGLIDGLSIDTWLKHVIGEGLFKEALVTYANWLNTNKYGMLFGLLFAVILMALMPVIKAYIHLKPSGFQASLLGLVMGAPLGVCVNCAAPIAYGLYKRGASAELAIATMISSPTFNFIVISMLLTLFAWPVVLIKLALTLLCMFVVVPLLVRVFETEAYADAGVVDASCAIAPVYEPSIATTGMESLKWVLASLLENARSLFLKMLPIMLLAGLLGSVLITALPWDELVKVLASHGRLVDVAMLFGLALFGLLLPVPITFDVIVCATLLNAGLPIKYVATLLLVLGSFSIYSFLVLWKAGAKRIACGLVCSLIVLGVVAGVITHYAERAYDAYLQETVYSRLQRAGEIRHQVQRPGVLSVLPTLPTPVQWMPLSYHSSIQFLQFTERAVAADAEWQFNQHANAGFLYHPKTVVHTSILPFNHLHSLAAGDVNNDQWVDLLVGTTSGLYLYLNTGGQFQPILIPVLSDIDHPVAAIALVDLNNDGWLDVFYNLVEQGSFISYSRQGQFTTPIQISKPTAMLALAVGIGDIDHNGELDIMLGNHNGLGWQLLSQKASRNMMILQHDGHFTVQPLPGLPGETLSLLLSDLNQDGWLDLLVGNDFDEPDSYFWGQANATWLAWPKDSLKSTTTTTMSIDSADINNDLLLDTYHAQISRNPASPPFKIKQRSLKDKYAELCTTDVSRTSAKIVLICDNTQARIRFQSQDVTDCLLLPEQQQLDCIAGHFFKRGFKNNDPQRADSLMPYYAEIARHYRQTFSQPRKNKPTDRLFADSLAQTLKTNLLYIQNLSSDDQTSQFIQQDKALGADIAGWSWNARFADLDGDQWQDLFVVNGWSNQRFENENVWFKNQQGQGFLNQAEAIGLADFEPTISFVSMDYDNDGDLDVITFSGMGILTAYTNNEVNNHHLQIQLDDHLGNRAGIGSLITIHYGEHGNLHQLRELKASGGYLSQDPAIAHFGLGEFAQISAIDVRWSTGETSHYNGLFETGRRYLISR